MDMQKVYSSCRKMSMHFYTMRKLDNLYKKDKTGNRLFALTSAYFLKMKFQNRSLISGLLEYDTL